jgi:hypothetical protein
MNWNSTYNRDWAHLGLISEKIVWDTERAMSADCSDTDPEGREQDRSHAANNPQPGSEGEQLHAKRLIALTIPNLMCKWRHSPPGP